MDHSSDQKPLMAHNILYFESGVLGGGSFESLYQSVKGMDRNRFNPVVVFLHHTQYVNFFERIDVPVYVLRDWLLSPIVSLPMQIVVRGTRRLASIVNQLWPGFYLKFLNIIHKPLVNQLAQLIWSLNINLVHLNVQIHRDIPGLLAAHHAHLPCISHLRSTRSERCLNNDAKTSRWLNAHVNIFIANSNATKKYWQNHGIEAGKIKTIYNGILETKIDPLPIRKLWSIDDSKLLIGCVGNFTTAKGHSFLLQAITKFIQHYPNTMLLLAGEGPLKHALEQRVKQLNLEEHVKFVGYVKNPANFIASLDILILPSKQEAFGRVLLEAMMAKTPIIASAVDGIKEVITHKHDGLLVEYNDIDALCFSLRLLCKNNDLSKRLVENAQKTLWKNFGMDYYCNQLYQVYDSVLSGERFQSE